MNKLTEKNAVILSISLIGILLLLFYLVPYKSLHKDKVNLNNEINSLQATYNVLSQDIANKQEFLDGIEKAKLTIAELDIKLPPLLNQELLIYTINDIEKFINIRFPTVSFEVVAPIFTLYENATLPGQEFAIKTAVATSASMTYQQLKNLLNYLYQDEDGLSKENRIVLRNLQIASNLEEDTLSTAFTLSFYGLDSEGRTQRVVDLGDFEPKNNGVFVPLDGYGESKPQENQSSGDTKDKTPDFYMIIDPTTADNMAFTLGYYDTQDASAYLYADENANINVEMEIAQENNKYYYRYNVAGQKYPENYTQGKEFNPQTTLELKISSASRVNDEDKSGVNLTIINTSDMPMNIVYYKEDATRPRLNIVKTVGDVIIR